MDHRKAYFILDFSPQFNFSPFSYLSPGIRRGRPDRQPGGAPRGQHANERLREPDLQIFRGHHHLNSLNNNNRVRIKQELYHQLREREKT